MEQKRFILAMVLSGIVLIVWQGFFAPPAEEMAAPDQAAQEQQEQQEQADQQEQAAQQGQAARQEQPGQAQAAPGQAAQGQAAQGQDQPGAAQRDIPVRRDIMRGGQLVVELTNAGARVTSARITDPEQYVARGDLVGFPEDAQHYPFDTVFLDKNFDMPANPVYELVDSESVRGEEGYSRIVYRYADAQGRFQIDKIFEVDESLPYVINMDVVLTNQMSEARLVDTLAVDLYDWKDPNKETSFLDFQPNEVEGVCRNTEDTERESIGGLDARQRFSEGQTQWGAVDTRYFMMAAIPAEPAEYCELEVIDTNYMRTRIAHKGFSLAPASSQTVSHQLFLGPKDVDVLNEVGHRLEESVDYGMFAFIARPMRWGLNQLFGIVGNWGLAIILLTFIIRGALWPVNMKAYSSMERMKAVQPRLEEVKKKYEDDRQRMTEETMKIFREENVSPAGGCLPMLLQMPILYGLYVMIYNSVDLYHADFALWYTNLAEPDPYYVLPAMMGIVMFAQQRMSTMDTTNKQAAMMMKIMPVMFTAFMVFLPSGLVLYYALSLLIGVGQQFYVRKKFSTEEAS